jgi:hypothetical protein
MKGFLVATVLHRQQHPHTSNPRLHKHQAPPTRRAVSCELGLKEATGPTGGTQHREYWGGPANGRAVACRRRPRRGLRVGLGSVPGVHFRGYRPVKSSLIGKQKPVGGALVGGAVHHIAHLFEFDHLIFHLTFLYAGWQLRVLRYTGR